MYFQSSSESGLRFTTYDTRCLHLCQISNWSSCSSLFWSVYVALVKLIFIKQIFTAIVKMYFQSFSELFKGFKAYDTRYRNFCRISNWSNCRQQFWSNDITWVIVSFFKRKLSFLSSKCVFKCPLNGFYDLEPMIQVVWIFCQISNWRNCRSLFSSGHLTLVNLIIFVKGNFAAIVQMCFQSFPGCFIGFNAYDTRYLHFY